MKIQPPEFHFCPYCGGKLGEITEEGKARAHCDNCDWTYYPHPPIAVAGIIIRDVGNGAEVLLVKRLREPKSGFWSIPSGFVDYDEDPVKALERELDEEVGLELRSANLVAHRLGYTDPRSPVVLVLFFEAGFNGEPVNHDHEENDAVEWHLLNEMPPMAWPSHLEVLDEIRFRLNRAKAH
jgi:ADP-ribose pyrophosphatase YjhB (NUDIX family)